MPRFTALSIVAPHGLNVANGRKTLEVRSWHPNLLPLENLLIVENDHFLINEGDCDANDLTRQSAAAALKLQSSLNSCGLRWMHCK